MSGQTGVQQQSGAQRQSGGQGLAGGRAWAPRLKMAAMALGAAALAACATATPYQQANAPGSNSYGFSEQRIESDRFRVSFSGNSLTDRETVEAYLLYRAAELTLMEGYDYFRLVDRDTERRTQFRSTGVGPYSPFYPNFYPHWSYYHPYYGWRGAYDPFWNGRGDLREVTRYEASAEIKVYKGRKPQDDPTAFDAQEVVTNLEPRIQRPVG